MANLWTQPINNDGNHVLRTHQPDLQWRASSRNFRCGSEEGVTLCLHPPFSGRGSTKQQEVRQLRSMITKQGLMWIKTGDEEWTINLDAFLQQSFAAEIRKKEWKWLHGVIAMRPDLQEMPVTHDELTLHLDSSKAMTVVFDLTSESIGQNRDQGTRAKSSDTQKLIFISHSSLDEDLSNALVSLLCSALGLVKKHFLCITVAGSKLPPGVRTDDALRGEIASTKAFLSILTPAALKSTYVLFELGARWVLGKDHIPLLAKGAGIEVLKEPLKPTIALDLSSEEDVHRLIERLSESLVPVATVQSPASYVKEIQAVLKFARPVGRARRKPSYLDLAPLAESARTHLNECVAAINAGTKPERALKRVDEIQQLWNDREKLVVIIDDKAVVFHPNSQVIGMKLEACWRDYRSGRSSYCEMTEEFGMTTLRIEGHSNRTTLLLWQHVPKWHWIVVLEVHLYHSD